MSNLVLELRAGEMMVVNGAAIRFRSRSRIELASRARFLFGKQIMAPNEANTPARRIYSALQTAYIGTDEERSSARGVAAELIAMFRDATTSMVARTILDEAKQAVAEDDCYRALRLARRIIQHEEAVLGVPVDADVAGTLSDAVSETPRAAVAAAQEPMRARSLHENCPLTSGARVTPR